MLLTEEPQPIYGEEWSDSYYLSGDSLPDNVEAFGVVAQVVALDSIHNCMVVIELHDAETDSLLLWKGLAAEDGKFPQGENVLVNALNFDEEYSPKGKTIKMYLWNQGHDQMLLNRVSYYTTLKSRILKGLYDPLN